MHVHTESSIYEKYVFIHSMTWYIPAEEIFQAYKCKADCEVTVSKKVNYLTL